MKWLASLFSSVLLLLMISCGGGRNMVSSMSPSPSMSGNFGMRAVSVGMDTFLIGGPIQSSPNGSVSGTVRIDSATSPCFDFFTPVTVSGMISSMGQLSLTSSAFQSQVINVTGMLSSDGKTISNGTFSITGGCAAGIHGSLSGFQVAMVNGAFSGSFSAGGSTIGITAMLSQGSSLNDFGLSGTATFTNGGSCGLTTANIVASETGFIAGADVRAGMLASQTIVASLSGSVADATARSIKGMLTIPAGPCAGSSVPVTLTMP